MTYVIWFGKQKRYAKAVEVEKMEKLTEMPMPARRTDREAILLPTRPKAVVVCPKCWTAQRSDRDRCYHCGTVFAYVDEE